MGKGAMSTLRMLTPQGDTVVKEWDVADEQSVAEVKEKFDAMVAAGNLAYRIDSPAGGAVIRDFDPAAQEILITAPLVGG